MTEQAGKVIELEMRISVIEKSFDELSDMVTKQWQMIDQLKLKIGTLENQLEGKQDRSEGTADEPPPPHY
ncbi:MAG: SlyX family protein [Rhodospirillales bacterium]|nr:SlyX family protein [Rhodospirillales bacterium]